jgi:uncharacterized protein
MSLSRTIIGFVGRTPLVTFTVLAYAFSWWSALFPGGGLIAFGPTLAALVVIVVTEGRSGLKAWWRRMVRVGNGWRWYVLAALIPAALAAGAGLWNVALGARVPAEIEWADPIVALPVLLVLGGMWEEPGWTGFALPRFTERFGNSRFGTIVATSVLAAIRAGWHVPLIFAGAIPWWDLPFIVGFQFVMSWLFFGSGSVLPVMLMHLVSNTVGGAFVSTWFTGSDWTTDSLLRAVLWVLLSLGLVLGRPRHQDHDRSPRLDADPSQPGSTY